MPTDATIKATTGYEKRDVRAKWIFGILGFLTVAGIIMHFSLAEFMRHLKKRERASDDISKAHAQRSAVGKPKAYSRLQISPVYDLQKFRAREEAELNTYGWIDRSAGVVRVPIDRAMDLIVQRGLPTRAGTNEDQIGPSNYELQKSRIQDAEKEGKR